MKKKNVPIKYTNRDFDSFLARDEVINAFAVLEDPVNVNLLSLFVRSNNSLVS